MSLTSDAFANIRHRLGLMRDEIDQDPDVVMIRVAIAVNKRNHKVMACYVHIEREYDAAAPGVLLDLQLDKPE